MENMKINDKYLRNQGSYISWRGCFRLVNDNPTNTLKSSGSIISNSLLLRSTSTGWGTSAHASKPSRWWSTVKK